MRMAISAKILATAASMAASTAHAGGLPGMRGHDHTGITVPDLKQAVGLFTDILGCQTALSFGPIADDKGSFMTDALGVDPKAEIEKVTMVRCGFGSNIELFQYAAPDQRDLKQKNSDIGAFHIALYVDDIAAAKAYLDQNNVATRLGPIPITEGENGGQSILYFQAPWGLQFEAISYPDGMNYEKTATSKLWDTRNPGQ
ncbi:VOC family protein [Rhizobium halophytocola]